MTFSLRFLVLSVLGLALLGLPVYSQILVPGACAAITTLGGWLAGYPEVVHGARLQADPGAFFVEVGEECLGVEAWLVFSAAVLAFPVPARRRVYAVLIAMGFVALYNSLRVASLYRLGLWSPAAAEWAHQWVFNMPFLIVYMILLYVVGVSGDGSLAAMRQRLTKSELKFWGEALALLTASLVLWHVYGPACVEAALRGFTGLLVSVLSGGYISDVSLPARPGLGWQFALPSFSHGIDGRLHSADIPFNYIAYLLLPLVTFSLCQSLLGGSRRWQWRAWRLGLVAGVLWYGLGLVVAVVHVQSIAAMHMASPFSPYIEPPSYTLLAPSGLPVLFYGSGWLFEVFFVLSNVAGFALWAEQAVRNHPATQPD